MKTHGRLPALNGRLVMELDRGRVRELLTVVALSALMLLPLLVYVWLNTEWIQSGYRLEQLKNERDLLVEAQHQLRLERASLQNLTRIEEVATGRLGLAQPPGGTVLLVDTRRLKPAPATAPGRLARAGSGTGSGREERDASVIGTN